MEDDDLYDPFVESPALQSPARHPSTCPIPPQPSIQQSQASTPLALSSSTPLQSQPSVSSTPLYSQPSVSSTPLYSQLSVSSTPLYSQPSVSSTPLQSQPSVSSVSSTPSTASSLVPRSIFSSEEYICSTACRQEGPIPVKEKKRSRKPSPSRHKQQSSQEQLDGFLSRGCQCASQCYKQFNRSHYETIRDGTIGLTNTELDMLLKGQIMAFTSVDDVVGPSHHHTPHQRQHTRAQTFLHAGRKVCRSTFLALHGIGKK